MIEIYVDNNPEFAGLKIYIIERLPNGKIAVGKPMDLELEIQEEGFELPEPTLKLNPNIGEEFLKAMATMLDNRGIKTKSMHTIEGNLEATKYHLEDLRKMLKLNK